MDELTAEILLHARNEGDKNRALTASVYSLGSRNELQKAIDLGLRILKDLDEPFPTNPSVFSILRQLFKTKRMLRRQSFDEIINLPPMRDSRKLSAMRIMNFLFAYTLNGRPLYAPLVSMRLVQMSLLHGVSGMSCVGFSSYAMHSCIAFGDVDTGIEIRRVGLKVLERFDAK